LSSSALSLISLVHSLTTTTMHPPLDLHLHPKCGEVINALHECHKSTFKRLTGGCNLERRLLDECLGEEVRSLALRVLLVVFRRVEGAELISPVV